MYDVRMDEARVLSQRRERQRENGERMNGDTYPGR